MKAPSRRTLIAALLLAASAARAAPERASGAPSRADRAEAWQDDVASPENFPRFAEGAREHRGEVPDPAAARAADPYARRPTLRPFAASAQARLDPPPLPPLDVSARAAAPARDIPIGSLAACALIGGLGCLLLALGGASAASTVELSPPSARPLPRTSEPVRLPEPSRARPRTPPEEPAAPVEESLADAYAPIASWRAISWREQELIEGWNRSPEKARGRASFVEWLDARGGVDGVDVPRLKAKLHREAA